jgi:hypothetical protein
LRTKINKSGAELLFKLKNVADGSIKTAMPSIVVCSSVSSLDLFIEFWSILIFFEVFNIIPDPFDVRLCVLNSFLELGVFHLVLADFLTNSSQALFKGFKPPLLDSKAAALKADLLLDVNFVLEIGITG